MDTSAPAAIAAAAPLPKMCRAASAKRTLRPGRICQRAVDDHLHQRVDHRDQRQRIKKRRCRISPWIARFSCREKHRFESPIRKNQHQHYLQASHAR